MKAIIAVAVLLLQILGATGAFADTFGGGTNTFDIEFVTIGNPGNADDTTGSPSNPFAGSVLYEYRIGKFGISEDMINKANTLGGLGVTKDTRGVDKPATRITWNEAARFVNWLNTSQGITPAYKFAVQPGEGGYNQNANIQLWDPNDTGYNPNNLFRNSLAKYVLPSVDEWYKAAYYDPNSGVYFDYPTGSDTAPTPVASGTAADTAVYDQLFSAGPANVTLAGGLSPYGTMGQGGNVWEWEETELDLVNDSPSSFREARGGFWDGPSDILATSFRFGNGFSSSGFRFLGFRVASIPEPSTLLLALAATIGPLLRRRPTR